MAAMGVALAFLGVLLGDLIVTKDGKRYEGEVVAETDDWITIRTDRGTSRVRKSFVARWDKEKKDTGGRLRYFVLKGGGVKVGEVADEDRHSFTIRVRGGTEKIRRSLVVESAPCGFSSSPSGPAKELRNPRSHRRGTVEAVYALAFARGEAPAGLDLDTLVTMYLDPVEPHAARLAAIELMPAARPACAEVIDALVAATTDGNKELRLRGADSLLVLAKEPRARKHFEALVVRWLAEGGPRERSWAVEAALAENVTTAIRELRLLLDSRERTLKIRAASALARLGGRTEVGLLMGAAQGASDEVLRRGLLKALREAVGEADAEKFAATLPALDPRKVEVTGSTDVERRVDLHLDRVEGEAAARELAEENALAVEVVPAAKKYLSNSKPVTLRLNGARLILAFRWIARQAGVSVSVKPGRVRVLPGRMTADMSSAEERAHIAERLGARIALPGGNLEKCFHDVGRLAGVNVVVSAAIAEKDLSMTGLGASRATARELLEKLCRMTRFSWSVLDGAVYVRR